MDDIVYEGKWWLGDDLSNSISGLLKIEKGKYNLYLNGKIQSNLTEFNGFTCTTKEVIFEKKYINGVTKNGKRISLYKYHQIKNNYVLIGDGYDTEVLQVEYVFEGLNILNSQSIEVKSIKFTFDDLFEWIGSGLVDFSVTKFDGNNFCSKGDLKFSNNFETLLGNIDKNRTLKINQSYNIIPENSTFKKLNNHHTIFKSLNITQVAKLFLFYNNFVDFDSMLDDIEHLRKFYSLVIGKPIKFDNFNGEINGVKNTIILSSNFSLKNIDTKNDNNMLFNFDDIKDSFEIILSNWFLNLEKYKLIYDIYFSTIENKGLHIENYFLNIIQAIEGYYYITFGTEKLVDDDKYDLIKIGLKKFIKESDIEFKKFLIVKPNFEKVDLKGKIEKISNKIDYLITDKDYIIDCRHKLSHGDNRNFIYKNLNRFYHKTLELKLVLELLIIKDLVDDKIFENIKKSRREDMIHKLP